MRMVAKSSMERSTLGLDGGSLGLFLKYGFLDSITGFKIAISIASEVILKYKKLRLFSSK